MQLPQDEIQTEINAMFRHINNIRHYIRHYIRHHQTIGAVSIRHIRHYNARVHVCACVREYIYPCVGRVGRVGCMYILLKNK